MDFYLCNIGILNITIYSAVSITSKMLMEHNIDIYSQSKCRFDYIKAASASSIWPPLEDNNLHVNIDVF